MCPGQAEGVLAVPTLCPLNIRGLKHYVSQRGHTALMPIPCEEGNCQWMEWMETNTRIVCREKLFVGFL